MILPNPAEIQLMKRLEKLGISTKTYRHAPFFTVEDAQRQRAHMPGGHCKSLFLKSKKDELILIIMDENGRLDLKTFAKTMGFARLSFASDILLNDYLGVRPGSVTPFALINWPENDPLSLIFDTRMMMHDVLHYHPLHNEATLAIQPQDLVRFAKEHGHEPQILELPLLPK